MNHITSPDEPFPSPTHLAAATTTHRQGHFAISSRKLPISKSGPIDAMSRALGIPVPEMIFGDNLVSVSHAPTGWRIEFNAQDALDAVDKTGRDMLQVAYARDWSSSREKTSAGIKEVVKPYDWSYSTTYRGTTVTAAYPAAVAPPPVVDGEGEEKVEMGKEEVAAALGLATEWRPTTRQIPIELLKRRDPILFFDDVMLYESELDDNGISVLSVKVRVHEHRMLLLCRLFMRVDNVVLRVRDTRIYVDFDTDEVLREYTAKEDSFANVKRALSMSGQLPDEITASLRDPNVMASMLPTVEQSLEGVSLSPAKSN